MDIRPQCWPLVILIILITGTLMNNPALSVLNIVHMEQPEFLPVLKNKAQSVSFPLSDTDTQLIDHMKSKLSDLGGVGLAAPQVNQPRQILAIYISEEATLLREGAKPYPMHIMINPSYSPAPGASIVFDFEVCYSVLNKAGKVPRYDEIHLKYFDESGLMHERIEHGFYARVIQHEIDHLNGILIVDRLLPDCVQGTINEMMTLRRSELSEEKRVVFDKLTEKN